MLPASYHRHTLSHRNPASAAVKPSIHLNGISSLPILYTKTSSSPYLHPPDAEKNISLVSLKSQRSVSQRRVHLGQSTATTRTYGVPRPMLWSGYRTPKMVGPSPDTYGSIEKRKGTLPGSCDMSIRMAIRPTVSYQSLCSTSTQSPTRGLASECFRRTHARSTFVVVLLAHRRFCFAGCNSISEPLLSRTLNVICAVSSTMIADVFPIGYVARAKPQAPKHDLHCSTLQGGEVLT